MEHPIFACSMAVFCVNKVGRHGGNPHAFSPKKTKRKGVNCRNTTKSITLPSGWFMTTTGQHIWSRAPHMGQKEPSPGQTEPKRSVTLGLRIPPHYRALQGQGETLGIIGRDMAYDTQGAIHLAFSRFICPGLGSSCPVGAFIGQSCVHAKLKYGTARKRTSYIKLSQTE